MKKTINFSDLKREEVRKILGEGENQIIIYNPSPENKSKIEDIMKNSFSKDGKEMLISAEDILLDMLDLTTNIKLDLSRDSEEDMKKIKNIIEDPKPIFEDAIIEVRELITEIGGRYMDTINTLAKLPAEELLKLFPQKVEIVETPEEKALREAEESIVTLKEKLKESKLKKVETNEIIKTEE